jgi:tetratricopeptide (TPR) repeat protein
MYQASCGFFDDAAEVFERAIKALPNNILLYFTYARFEEGRKNYDKAKEIFERLLKQHEDPIVYIQYQKFMRRTKVILVG